MIKYPISRYYITVKLYDINGGVKTELCQKMLLQVSICELNIDMLKKYATGFPWNVLKNDLYVLVILIFNYFLHLNYKIQHSIIKLCVVNKFASRMNHTNNNLIIGVKYD